MEDIKVLAVSTGSIGSMSMIDQIVVGQPIINLIIGFLTVIYLVKRILIKEKK